MGNRQKLPTCWYWHQEELAAEWQCSTARVRYYMDAGLIQPAALVPRWKLQQGVPAGPAPEVCVILGNYRELRWVHAEDGSAAELVGTFSAFAVDQQWFSHFPLELKEPVSIRREDLVITLEGKEHLEQIERLGAVGGLNPIERKTLLAIIGALVSQDLALDLMGPYSVANVILEELGSATMALSQETIASKVKEARKLVAAAGQSKDGLSPSPGTVAVA